MATTPEGAIKKEVRRVLDQFPVYYFMPVQHGYGSSTLDFLCCHVGRFFAIEAKAPGKHPTERQLMIMATMKSCHGKVFVIDDVKGCQMLRAWLQGLVE